MDGKHGHLPLYMVESSHIFIFFATQASQVPIWPKSGGQLEWKAMEVPYALGPAWYHLPKAQQPIDCSFISIILLTKIYAFFSCRNHYDHLESLGQEEDHQFYYTAFGGWYPLGTLAGLRANRGLFAFFLKQVVQDGM